MSLLQTMLLSLPPLQLPRTTAAAPPAEEPARLRELLYDRQFPGSQNQAALLLVQESGAEAEDVVRRGLRQTDNADVFQALTAALRLTRDNRFTDELFEALVGGRATIRRAAAETLAVLVEGPSLRRLQLLIEDNRLEPAVRFQAVWALGRSGKKPALAVLVELLGSPEEDMRQAAAEALADLTGLTFGLDPARWRAWWLAHKDEPNERWLEQRLGYQASRARRLEGELERAKAQVVQLQQQLYQRLPAADRLGHVQGLLDHEDPAVRSLAVTWSLELLAQADGVGQRALGDLLLRLSLDGEVGVQRAATLALGRVTEVRAFEQLCRLLRTGKAPVRSAAANALARHIQTRPAGATGPAGLPDPDRIQQVVPLLQKALEDPALEVVVAAAEGLGTLGVPEAGPVLASLLRHPSEPVRQTAASALERIADPTVFDHLLAALEDQAVTVRFSLVGALGRLTNEARTFTEGQRSRMLTRLEELLLRDPDSGVRSRAATVIGQSGAQVELPFLWRRLQGREDARVQEKAWGAMIEILARSGNLELLRQWDRTLGLANQAARRVELLTEISDRWKKVDATRTGAAGAVELLIQAHLEQGKWNAAFPLIHELLERPGSNEDVHRRLGWLLQAGERALLDGNPTEALRAVREAQPFLARSNGLVGDFEKLDKQARKQP